MKSYIQILTRILCWTMVAALGVTSISLPAVSAFAEPADAGSAISRIEPSSEFIEPLAEDQNQEDRTWDVSANQDGTVWASVEKSLDGSTYTLSIEGEGAMQSFEPTCAPWVASYKDSITEVLIGEDVTNIGAYAFELPNLKELRAGVALETIEPHAIEGANGLIALDLSKSSLKNVDAQAITIEASSLKTSPTIYVKDPDSAEAFKQIDADLQKRFALAVVNGGSFQEDVAFQSGQLISPEREGFTFVTWTTDEALMWPESYWKPMSQNTFYARFVERAEVTEPVQYKGYQGYDQRVTLLDASALPSSIVDTSILFYGETDECFDNRYSDDRYFNTDDDIVFAFNFARGSNANGGNGDYQMSFLLPYISILDSSGRVVASYDDGAGLLRKYSIIFDGVDGKIEGRTITAVKIGVGANTLEAGTYTLRFSKDMGANNGISFLGKNVDLQFKVIEKPKYELVYAFDDAARTASVSGLNVFAQEPFDVVIPASVTNPTNSSVYAIDGVAQNAFAGSSAIRSVTIPAGVQSIGDGAFSNMGALQYVKLLSRSGTNTPSWGSGVFSGSSACLLYGYAASSAEAAADAYANVSFHPLENGVYANGEALQSGSVIHMTQDEPTVTIRAIDNSTFVTTNYCSYITDTSVASHANTSPYGWNVITGNANGTTKMEIRSAIGASKGTLLMSVNIECAGFSKDADPKLVPAAQYQGNGATISLQGAGAILNSPYDETLTYFDNYIEDGIPFVDTVLTLDVSGPGSAWGPEHGGWNWAQFLNNVNRCIWLENAQGSKVATPGNGLTITKLVQSPSTIQFTVNAGVLSAGSSYTLVVSEDMTGHNVAASLKKAVHWTFVATKADISKGSYSISDPADCLWTGEEHQPQVLVWAPVMGTSIWNDDTRVQETAPDSVRLLEEGVDYELSYENNVDPSTAAAPAYAVIKGIGNYQGEVRKTFSIIDPNAIQKIDMHRLYNPNSGEHFYTASDYERDALVEVGWVYEGIGWTAPSTSSSPVYRLYSGTDHHYTMSAPERDALVVAGWEYEGIGWYSDDAQGVPLYRQFNPYVNPAAPTNNSGSHNYTTSKAENDVLVSVGWSEEGIGWYGVN